MWVYPEWPHLSTPGVCDKARNTESFMEMNSKIWRLRKKYAGIIVDEIMVGNDDGPKTKKAK